MSRVLFGVGAQGSLITTLQSALAGNGFDPKGSDGIYGKDTESAVKSYQTAHGHSATGQVTDDQWQPLTNTGVPDVEARSLQLTSTFEGHGYTLAQGNWDGAWITWGIIGFTLKHGEIQAIVSSIEQQAPECIDQAFGAEADAFRAMIAASAAEQEAFANSVSIGSRLAEPWRTHFQAFGNFPQVQAEQRARAHAAYFSPAARNAEALGLGSELGVALSFDIQVQNGGVSAALRNTILAQTAGQPEAAVREAVANAVADNSKAEFREDVRSRKLAIARGQGTVHGRNVVLANWGLAQFPAVIAP
jgi:putative peptidoglycan binding protein/glycosyl hydrolase family 46